MPTYPATSGIARSGEVESGNLAPTGVFTETLAITIGGTDRTASVDLDELVIVQGLCSEPSTFTAIVKPRGVYTPTRGQELEVWIGGVNEGIALFAGTILSTTLQVDRVAHESTYVVEAIDYRWLMDRNSRVTASYQDMGVNMILARLLSDFTDAASDFRLGYCDQALGDVTIDFQDQTVTSCIEALSQVAGDDACWTILPTHDGGKRVSIYEHDNSDGPANSYTLGDTGLWRQLQVVTDISQVANKVIVIGGGSTTTATMDPTQTNLAVEDTQLFASGGGTVLVGGNVVTYTGRSVNSGPGNLTGCSGHTSQIQVGVPVQNRAVAEDASAQSDLATILGGGQSGVSEYVERDDALNASGTSSRATFRLGQLKNPNIQLQFALAPFPLNESSPIQEDVLALVPGQRVTASLTAPITLTGQYLVRQVTLAFRSRRSDGVAVFDRLYQAERFRTSLTQVLKTALET